MQELQHQVLDSDQVGNLFELDRAFTWFVQRLEEGEIAASTIEANPLAIAFQVIEWWVHSMQESDAKIRTTLGASEPND